MPETFDLIDSLDRRLMMGVASCSNTEENRSTRLELRAIGSVRRIDSSRRHSKWNYNYTLRQ